MPGIVQRYAQWLHGQWPSGTVEKLPEVDESGRTNVPGLYVTGDLTGIPLLKFSLDTGTRAVRGIAAELGETGKSEVTDIAIVGAGVSGMAAAMEARRLGLSFRVLEASEPFFTIVNFPRGKPIFTYPRTMTPEGDLQVTAEIKEDLVEELQEQVTAAGITTEPARVQAVRRRGRRFGGDVMRALLDHPQLRNVEAVALWCKPEHMRFYEELGFRDDVRGMRLMLRGDVEGV